MATAQKRGFHFPWGSEPRNEDSESTTESGARDPRPAGAPEDLGRGPFDLAQAGALTEVPEAPEAGLHAAEDVAPDTDPVSASAAAAAAPARGAWPEADQRSNRPQATAPRPAAAPAPAAPAAILPPRRENPLVAGLVRAMRDATRVARDEQVAALRTDAGTHGEAIRARSTAATAELRRSADTDVAGIRAWSKAEMARLREETDARIAARKSQLVADTEAEAQAAKDLLGRLATSIQAFEAETAAFFEALLAEDDPARLAGLAERMPQPPTLDEFPASESPAPTPRARNQRTASAGSRPAAARAAPKSRPNAAATAAALAPKAPETPVVADETALENEPALPSEPLPADEPVIAEGLDADAAAAAEAEALLGLDGQTQLTVSGLVSVGGIAAFKAGLMRSAGVNAVSVTAGTDGDFLFTVTHDRDAEVREAIRAMDTFDARVIADDGDSLVVVAHEPAA